MIISPDSIKRGDRTELVRSSFHLARTTPILPRHGLLSPVKVDHGCLMIHNIVFREERIGLKVTAITFEYLKVEILSISKPYLENLVYK